MFKTVVFKTADEIQNSGNYKGFNIDNGFVFARSPEEEKKVRDSNAFKKNEIYLYLPQIDKNLKEKTILDKNFTDDELAQCVSLSKDEIRAAITVLLAGKLAKKEKQLLADDVEKLIPKNDILPNEIKAFLKKKEIKFDKNATKDDLYVLYEKCFTT